MKEPTAVTIARIDENVKRLLETLPIIKELETKALVNENEHRAGKWVFGIFSISVGSWILKKIGLG